MTRLRRGAALLLALSACEPVISRSSALEGKACRMAERACLPGYSCQAGVCVAGSTQGEEAAAAGSSSRLDSNVEVAVLDDSGSNAGAGGAPPSDFASDVDAPVGSAGPGALTPDAHDAGGAGAPDAATTGDAGCAGHRQPLWQRDRQELLAEWPGPMLVVRERHRAGFPLQIAPGRSRQRPHGALRRAW